MKISEKSFVLESREVVHPIIEEFKKILELGEIDEDSAIMCELPLTEKLFLFELAAIRRFWINLEEITATNQKVLN